MQKNIVKSGDNTEKIKDTKEKINSQSIEESQKKAVSDETAADKLLNNEDKDKEKNKNQASKTSSYVSVSDYSNTYKYDSDNTSYNSDVVKSADSSQAVIYGNESSAIKEDNSHQSFHTDKSAVEESIKGYTASSQVGTKSQSSDDIAPAVRFGDGTNSAVKAERADRNIISSQTSGSVIKESTSNNVVRDNSEKSVVTDVSQNYFKSESNFSSEAKKENTVNKTRKAAQEAYRERITNEESTEQSNVFTSSQVGTKSQRSDSSDEIAPAVRFGDGTNNAVKDERADRNIISSQTSGNVIKDSTANNVVKDSSQKLVVTDVSQNYFKTERDFSSETKKENKADKTKKAAQKAYRERITNEESTEQSNVFTSSQVGTKSQRSDSSGEIAPAVRFGDGTNNAVKDERADRNIISQTSGNVIKESTSNNVVKDSSQKSVVTDVSQNYFKSERDFSSETKKENKADKTKKAAQEAYRERITNEESTEQSNVFTSSQVGTKLQRSDSSDEIALAVRFGDGTNNAVKDERADRNIISQTSGNVIKDSTANNVVKDSSQKSVVTDVSQGLKSKISERSNKNNTEKNVGYKRKRKGRQNKSTSAQSKMQQENNNTEVSSQVRNDVQNSKADTSASAQFSDDSIVKAERTDKGIIEHSSGELPITENNFNAAVIDNSQRSALSKTAADYIISENSNERSVFSKMSHKKLVKELNNNKNGIINEPDKTGVVNDERQIPVTKQEQQVFSVEDKGQNVTGDDIKIFTLKEDKKVYSGIKNKNAGMVADSRDKAELVVKKDIKSNVKSENKSGSVKDSGIVSFTGNAIKEKILSEAEHSDEDGTKAIGKGIVAVDILSTSSQVGTKPETDLSGIVRYTDNEHNTGKYDVKEDKISVSVNKKDFSENIVDKSQKAQIKSENSKNTSELPKDEKAPAAVKNKKDSKNKTGNEKMISDDKADNVVKNNTTNKKDTVNKKEAAKSNIIKGDFRRKGADKTATALSAKKYGLKDEFKKEATKAVLKRNAVMDKVINKSKSAAKNVIKGTIEEMADENMAFSAVDSTIKTVDTLKNIHSGTVSAVNSTIKLFKAPKKIAKGIKAKTNKFKERIKKLQKFARMNKSQKVMAVKKAVKKAAVQTTKAASNLMIKLLIGVGSFMMSFFVIIIAVVCIFCLFTWQTPTDLDTTEILKYVSKLDYEQQKEWFDSEYTNVRIEQTVYNNDEAQIRGSHNPPEYYNCKYFLAINPPTPTGEERSDWQITYSKWRTEEAGGETITHEKIEYKPYFYEVANSADEFLEKYRMTTNDYRAMLAYLQVKNDNLGWLSGFPSFITDAIQRDSINEIMKKIYNTEILTGTVNSDGGEEKDWTEPVITYSIKTTNKSKEQQHYFFGIKYSVKYLIENDIVRFDDDDVKNNELKEQFVYTYNYGNMFVSNLGYPLQLEEDEKISDRIVKHFGKQLSLEFTAPVDTKDSEGHDIDDFGSVTGKETFHYATDFKAEEGDVILAPISGLCKVSEREGRGFEYVISTAYNDSKTDFDFTKNGFLIKISCSGWRYVDLNRFFWVNSGDWLGIVGINPSVNYYVPDSSNDTENEDIYADALFPCFTGTTFHTIGKNTFSIPDPEYNYIHMEMYKLPCDFTKKEEIEKNVMAPELFFDYSKETIEFNTEPTTEPTT